MRFKIKIIEILDDLKSKSKSLNIRWLKSKSNHDFDFKIEIVPISACMDNLLLSTDIKFSAVYQ